VEATPLADAQRLLCEAVDALARAAGPRSADSELIGVLTLAEGVRRRIDLVMVGALADRQRRGTFADRGYRNPAAALGDLLGWERAEARRHLVVAEQASPRVGLDGTLLPPRLPATAAAFAAGAASFAAGAASLRQVEVVARVLGTDAAGRLTPAQWTAAEAQLAAWIPECGPQELQARGTQLVDTLDADGAQPDDRPRPSTNELFLTRSPDGAGGSLKGRFDDAAV
jgi:5-methylcytosine-specific restriction protein A